MRDDAKRPHFYVNPGQDTATGVLLPGRDRRTGPGRVPGAAPGLAAGPGRAPVSAAASPSLRDTGCPEQPGQRGNSAAASAGLALKSAGLGGHNKKEKKNNNNKNPVALLKGLSVRF